MLYSIQNIKTIFSFYSMLGFKSVFQRNANKSIEIITYISKIQEN